MQNRTHLLKNLRAVEKASRANPDDYRVSLAVKKALEKHVKSVPGDKSLTTLFARLGVEEFCKRVIGLLSETPDADLKSLKAPPLPKNKDTAAPASKKTKGTTRLEEVFKKIARVQRVEIDDLGAEPVPSDQELAAAYVGFLQEFFIRHPDPGTIDRFVFLVEEEEKNPPLFPLAERLRMLFKGSLLRFLAPTEVYSFFRRWNGTEGSLDAWSMEHRYAPLRVILEQDITVPEKVRRLGPVLSYWAVVEKNGLLNHLTPENLEDFFRLSDRHPRWNTLRVLSNVDMHRSVIHLDFSGREQSARLEVFYVFWDLSWVATGGVSRVVVPMQRTYRAFSEKQFASQYFDESSYQEGEVFMWCGKLPFRVEYTDPQGRRLVQSESMYKQHKERCLGGRGWETPLAVVPHNEMVVMETMCRGWVSASFGFLDPLLYDVDAMTALVLEPVFRESRTLGEVVERVYHVVGRLHPRFVLSKHHGIFRERVRNLYFALETMTKAPIPLLFPEYFCLRKDTRALVEKRWHRDYEEFKRILLLQCAREYFGVVAVPPQALLFVPPSHRLDRNSHVLEDGTIEALETHVPQWEEYLMDEDMVPLGLGAIGMFVEAPSYYSTTHRNRVSEDEFRAWLDTLLTRPPVFPYPVLNEDQAQEDEEDDQAEDEEKYDSEDEESTDYPCENISN